MYQAGTLSGNPVAVAAGKATLSVLKNEGIYQDLELRGTEFQCFRKSIDSYAVLGPWIAGVSP